MQLKPSRRNDLKEKYKLGARLSKKKKITREKSRVSEGTASNIVKNNKAFYKYIKGKKTVKDKMNALKYKTDA